MASEPNLGLAGKEPLFPMPPVTEQALRVAVLSLDPVAAVRFEQEFHGVWQEAVQTDSTVPMHTFLRRWAVFVALRRVPAPGASATRTRTDDRRRGQFGSRPSGCGRDGRDVGRGRPRSRRVNDWT
ncbi:hypothetical protein ACIBSV_45090 [Embleya sp. NPDC050154]|uniref:hypothetical protein n=1 Tax=Embleya sp. NPDC050154 TaxID=3363988 RepID=UPI003794F266